MIHGLLEESPEVLGVKFGEDLVRVLIL